jgi:hypothetical protein
MNVGVSKNLLSDRLRVTVGSNFDLEGSSQASSGNSNAIAGNVAVDYSLSKDRRYMIRGYRKNEYEGAIDGYIIETGVGFIITLDYNKFKNLFLGKKGREEKRQRIQRAKEQDQQQQQQKQTPPPVPQQTSIPSPENRELIKREDS